MTTFLVTGGAGLIGSNFILSMLARHSGIRIVDLDLLTYAGNPDNLAALREDPRHIFVRGDIGDRTLVAALLEKYDPDVVVHFAAESHVDRSIAQPDGFVRTNVLGTVNLLQCCKEAWFDDARGVCRASKKYVQVSTDEVYGTLGREGSFTETTPLSPRSPYSASKASADHFAMAFYETWGLPVTITRCSNNYGPRQFPEKLVPLVIRNAKRHLPVPVYGDGLQIRDWLYVEDHVRAVELAAAAGRDGEVYNVGGRNERTNIEVIRRILAILRRELDDAEINGSLIRSVKDRPGHDRRYSIDPAKITRELGWQPETGFEEGLEKTVRWYLSQPDWLARIESGAYRAGLPQEGGRCPE